MYNFIQKPLLLQIYQIYQTVCVGTILLTITHDLKEFPHPKELSVCLKPIISALARPRDKAGLLHTQTEKHNCILRTPKYSKAIVMAFRNNSN